MTDSYEERRISPRSNVENTLFIKSISSSQVKGYEDNQQAGSTINMSSHGLQVILDFEVLEAAEIALWVNHEANNERLLVSGTIRWVSKTAFKHKYLVGIALDKSCTESMRQWLIDHPTIDQAAHLK